MNARFALLCNGIAFAPISAIAQVPAPAAVLTDHPLMDAFISFAAVAIPILGGIALKYAQTHWNVMQDASINAALYAASLRLANSILTSTVVIAKDVPDLAPDHFVIAKAADKLIANYPGFTKQVGMDDIKAREMILSAVQEKAFDVRKSDTNTKPPPLTFPPVRPAT